MHDSLVEGPTKMNMYKAAEDFSRYVSKSRY